MAPKQSKLESLTCREREIHRLEAMRAVLDGEQRRGRVGWRWLALAGCAAVFAVAAVAPLQLVATARIGQQAGPPAARRPSFDAVSVRPFPYPNAPWHRQPQFDPKRLYIEGMSPSELINLAYGLNNNQVVGLPDWAEFSPNSLYTITATTDHPTSEDQMLLMLQRVIEESFHFTFTESNDVQPVYALEIAPGGAKLAPVTSDEGCIPSPELMKKAHIPPSGPGERIVVSQAGCDTVAELLKGLNQRSALAGDLPVIDKTGLTGTYTIVLWQKRGGCETVDGGGTRCADMESIQDAVKNELGLEYVKTTGPYRVLHVTGMQRPTAN